MATTVENLLLFDMGLCNSFPFIIIAALTGFPNQHNVNESLSLTAVQASWLGKFAMAYRNEYVKWDCVTRMEFNGNFVLKYFQEVLDMFPSPLAAFYRL